MAKQATYKRFADGWSVALCGQIVRLYSIESDALECVENLNHENVSGCKCSPIN